MDFCGYTIPESDNLRKGIAKKKGTSEQLSKLKEGFMKYSKPKYGLSDKRAEEIINPILKCVEDATRYAFSWNHADAYSFIGYACGYLRHYYPEAFIATCLNIWKDDNSKTVEITKFATRKKYKISEPKFRYSKSNYFYDKKGKTIYKGMESIKYLNRECSEELYALRNNDYESFTDLLLDIKNNVSIDSRKLDILIKLDYFSEFGNAKELTNIVKVFTDFKEGNAKQLSISKIENDESLKNIVKRHSRSTKTQYRDLDSIAIIKECEEYIKSQNLSDFPVKDKIADEIEYMGYVSIKTGKEEDRPKLVVLTKKALISKVGKNEGKPWCVSITTHSIGSGIQGSFTIPYGLFKKEPFNEKDIICCDKWKRHKGYNYIEQYHRIFL